MKVQNMTNAHGNKVPNQFIITDEGHGALGNFLKREVFQSYDSIIAIKTIWDKKDCTLPHQKTIDIELDINKWDYSKTTGRYRNIFLGETKKDTEAKIKNGTYILTDLNK
jgi:hypothetical protein